MNKKKFRFGVTSTGAITGDEWKKKVVRAEELGYSTFLIPDHFVEVLVSAGDLDAAVALGPIHTRNMLGKKACLFEDRPANELAHLGELHTPSVADLFVAKMKSHHVNEKVDVDE